MATHPEIAWQTSPWIWRPVIERMSYFEIQALCASNIELQQICSSDDLWMSLYFRDFGGFQENHKPVSWQLEYQIKQRNLQDKGPILCLIEDYLNSKYSLDKTIGPIQNVYTSTSGIFIHTVDGRIFRYPYFINSLDIEPKSFTKLELPPIQKVHPAKGGIIFQTPDNRVFIQLHKIKGNYTELTSAQLRFDKVWVSWETLYLNEVGTNQLYSTSIQEYYSIDLPEAVTTQGPKIDYTFSTIRDFFPSGKIYNIQNIIQTGARNSTVFTVLYGGNLLSYYGQNLLQYQDGSPFSQAIKTIYSEILTPDGQLFQVNTFRCQALFPTMRFKVAQDNLVDQNGRIYGRSFGKPNLSRVMTLGDSDEKVDQVSDNLYLTSKHNIYGVEGKQLDDKPARILSDVYGLGQTKSHINTAWFYPTILITTRMATFLQQKNPDGFLQFSEDLVWYERRVYLQIIRT